jgi:ammonia channel protein AmtB
MQRSTSIYRQAILPLIVGHIAHFENLGTLSFGVKASVKCALELSQKQTTHTVDGDVKLFTQHIIGGWNSQIPVIEQEMKRINIALNSKSVILEEARKKGTGENLLAIANEVTQETKSVLYPMIYPVVSTSIVEASFVQTYHLLNSRDKEQKKTLISNLKQNLIALKVVAERAEIVELMHGSFMAELSAFIERYDAVDNMDFSILISHG